MCRSSCCHTIGGRIENWDGEFFPWDRFGLNPLMQYTLASLDTVDGRVLFTGVDGSGATTVAGNLVVPESGLYEINGRLTLATAATTDVTFLAVATSATGVTRALGAVIIREGDLSENFYLKANLMGSETIRVFASEPVTLASTGTAMGGMMSYTYLATFIQVQLLGPTPANIPSQNTPGPAPTGLPAI